MKENKYKSQKPKKGGLITLFWVRVLIIILMLLLTSSVVFISYEHKPLLFVLVPIVIVLDALAIKLVLHFPMMQKINMEKIAQQIGTTKQEQLYAFPLPVLVCSNDGTILWYNEAFENKVSKFDKELIGQDFSKISTENIGDFCNRSGIQISYKDHYFHVYASFSKETNMYVFYFEENTNLIKIAREYELSRPYVMIVMIDNYTDIFDGKKDSIRSSIVGEVDQALENFVGESTGFLQRLSKDRFLIVMEKRDVEKVIEGKFKILDIISDIGKEEKVPITLSIGVGATAQTLGESEGFARQALDMSLGRGGDQAAVKTATGFEFFGGVSKGVERRTRVKSRVIATALRELVDQSDKVIVMGHRFGDLDCVGASIGLARTIRKLGKNSYIAVKYNKTLAVDLLDRVKECGFSDMLVHPDDAMDMVTKDTVLIIVDTHNPDFVESTKLYEKCEKVVVIDHHRKMVKHISNALIFYHEPFASSASELVTELIQYMGNNKLGEMEAEALLSGIMLDTKNFVIHVGVRTFEAAAYLKGLGADTVSVRKLFSNTIDSYQLKSRIVSGAETYRNCAISIGDSQSEDMRTVAPQAADELLGISGVDASFVIYMIGQTTHISARSLGIINAQVVMERLGGGGHQTQAACQLEDTSLEKARQMLLESIDETLGTVPE